MEGVLIGDQVLIGASRSPCPAAITFRAGVIELIERGSDALARPRAASCSSPSSSAAAGGAGGPGSSGALPVVDVGNHLVMPGLVDSHVHVNDPGSDLECKQRALAPADLAVDVALLGGVCPDNIGQIVPLVEEGGVVGFKSFLIHSGLDQFPSVSEADVRAAMGRFKELRAKGCDVVYMFHAELDCGCGGGAAGQAQPRPGAPPAGGDPRPYDTVLRSRRGGIDRKSG